MVAGVEVAGLGLDLEKKLQNQDGHGMESFRNMNGRDRSGMVPRPTYWSRAKKTKEYIPLLTV